MLIFFVPFWLRFRHYSRVDENSFVFYLESKTKANGSKQFNF